MGSSNSLACHEGTIPIWPKASRHTSCNLHTLSLFNCVDTMFLHDFKSLYMLLPSPGMPEHLLRPTSKPTFLWDHSQVHQNQQFSPCSTKSIKSQHTVIFYLQVHFSKETLRAIWGQKITVSVYPADHCLSKLSWNVFWISFQWQREFIMV